MVESRDINEVLAAGFFPTTRSKEAATSLGWPPDSPRVRRPVLPTLVESPSPELRETKDQFVWTPSYPSVSRPHHGPHPELAPPSADSPRLSGLSRHSLPTPKPSGPRPEPIAARSLAKSRERTASPTLSRSPGLYLSEPHASSPFTIASSTLASSAIALSALASSALASATLASSSTPASSTTASSTTASSTLASYAAASSTSASPSLSRPSLVLSPSTPANPSPPSALHPVCVDPILNDTCTSRESGPEDHTDSQPAYLSKYPPPPSVKGRAESSHEYGATVTEADDEEGHIPYKGDLDQMPLLIAVSEHNPERRFVLLTPGVSETAVLPQQPLTDSPIADVSPSSASRGPSGGAHPPGQDRRSHSHASFPHLHPHHPHHHQHPITRPIISQAHLPVLNHLHDAPARSRVRSVSSTVSAAQRGSEHPAATLSAGPSPTEYRSRPMSRTDSASLPEVIKHATVGGKRERADLSYGRRTSSTTSICTATPASRSQTTGGDDRRRDGQTISSPPISGPRSQSTFDLRRQNTSSLEQTDSLRLREPTDRVAGSAEPTRRRRSSVNTRPRWENDGRAADGSNSPHFSAASLRRPILDASDAVQTATGVFVVAQHSPYTDEEAAKLDGPPVSVTTAPIVVEKGKSKSSQAHDHLHLSSPRHSMPSLGILDDREYRDSDAATTAGLPSDPPAYSEEDSPAALPQVAARHLFARSRSRGSSVRLSMQTITPLETGSAGLLGANPPGKRQTAPGLHTDTPRTPQSAGFSSVGACHPHDPDPNIPEQTPTPVQTHSHYPTDPQPVNILRNYTEDSDGTWLPDCRRTKPVAGKTDWLTLEGTDSNFTICPLCYEAVFKSTQFRDSFVPSSLVRSAAREISCDFGAVPWYRIAWLLTLKDDNPDLASFRHIAASIRSAAAGLDSCPGDHPTTRSWFGINNVATGAPVCGFQVCSECTSIISILLPALKNVFVPIADAAPVRATCAMHFKEKRQRFVKLFDLLEATSNRATVAAVKTDPSTVGTADGLVSTATTIATAATNAATPITLPAPLPASTTVATTASTTASTPAPATTSAATAPVPHSSATFSTSPTTMSSPVLQINDLRRLTAQLERLTSFVECHTDTPVKDGGWHVLRSVPLFTVCGDCFDQVVRPRIDDGNPIARNFWVKARHLEAPTTCQLYSTRMRDVFRKACRRNDMAYLETRVRERCDVEAQIRARVERLSREAERDKRAADQLDHYLKEWKKWE